MASENHPRRWNSMEDALAACDEFSAAARRLINAQLEPGRVDLTEAEQLASRLLGCINATFCDWDGPSETSLLALRQAVAAFERPSTVREDRVRCLRAIELWGERWKSPEWRSTNETFTDRTPAAPRDYLLVSLAGDLAMVSPEIDAFVGPMDMVPLTVDLGWLAARIEGFEFSAAGRKGAKSSEKILAEIIALDLDSNGALGYAAREDEADDDAVERIRKALTRDRLNFEERLIK